MINIARTNSLPIPPRAPWITASSSTQTGTLFLDDHGVLRRSCADSRNVLIRGLSEGDVEFIRQRKEHNGDGSSDDDQSDHACDDDDDPDQDDILTQSRVLAEHREAHRLALERERLAQKQRRQLWQQARRESRRICLESHHAIVLERTQSWHDVTRCHPEAETTVEHTAQCPSPLSRSFIDEDGNLRRKSTRPRRFQFMQQAKQGYGEEEAGENSRLPSALFKVAALAAAAVTVAPPPTQRRTSLLVEFLENLLGD